MEPNNEQGIQLEYLSNLDVQQTNEWLDSVTVEQIMGLMNEPFDGEIYSKLLNLPAIEDPKGHTSMLLFGGMHSPMEIFEAFLEKNCQFVTCHLLMACNELTFFSKKTQNSIGKCIPPNNNILV